MSNYYEKSQKKKKKTKKPVDIKTNNASSSSSSASTTTSTTSPKKSSSTLSKKNRSSKKGLALDSFKQLHAISVGSFGHVSIVQHTETQVVYALKTVEKAALIRMDEVGSALFERQILNSLDLKCVVKLYKSFRDERRVYMLLEHVAGGSLHSHIVSGEGLEEKIVVYYTLEVANALDMLHAAGVAHGTLCAEHVVLDRDGHAKLVSFGGAAKLGNKRKSSSKGVGSRLVPLYAAPERFRGEAPSAPADWWALGVLVYEMFTGAPPFIADTPLALAELITSGDTARHLSHKRLPSSAKDAVKRLLQPAAAKRDNGAALRQTRWLKAAATTTHSSQAAPLAKVAGVVARQQLEASGERDDCGNSVAPSPDALLQRADSLCRSVPSLVRAAPPYGPPVDRDDKLFLPFGD